MRVCVLESEREIVRRAQGSMVESLQFLRIKDVFEREKQQGPASAGIWTVCGFRHLDGVAEQVEQDVFVP